MVAPRPSTWHNSTDAQIRALDQPMLGIPRFFAAEFPLTFAFPVVVLFCLDYILILLRELRSSLFFHKFQVFISNLMSILIDKIFFVQKKMEKFLDSGYFKNGRSDDGKPLIFEVPPI